MWSLSYDRKIVLASSKFITKFVIISTNFGLKSVETNKGCHSHLLPDKMTCSAFLELSKIYSVVP